MKKANFDIVPPSDVLAVLAQLDNSSSSSFLNSAASYIDQDKIRFDKLYHASFGPITKQLEAAGRLTEAFALNSAFRNEIASIDTVAKSLLKTGALASARDALQMTEPSSAMAAALRGLTELPPSTAATLKALAEPSSAMAAALKAASQLTAASQLVNFYKMDHLLESVNLRSNLYDINLVQPSLRLASEDLFKAFEPAVAAYRAWRSSAIEVFDPKKFTPIDIPVREQFLSADILSSLQKKHKDSNEVAVEREVLIEEVEDHLLITLEEALNQINPSLYGLWDGAWQAMGSSNPDKIRHTLTSARELVRIVVHELSPDSEVKAWSTDANHYHNGNPTNRARLMFIFSHVEEASFQEYLDREVEACLYLINLFNSGTHSLTSSLNEKQLKIVLRKVHSMICSLVEIKSGGRNEQ